jgi:16S rRNA (guanine966-N2)-methyltransferase
MPLEYPRRESLRPTSERVRESLFSSLQAELPGARVADLFAGTGALGLEALSRGAELVVFVESSRAAEQAILANVRKLGVVDRTAVIHDRVERAWLEVAARWGPFGVVLLDPPYAYAGWPDLLPALLDEQVGTTPDTIVVVEHDRRHPPASPRPPYRVKVLGETQLSWFAPAPRAEE